MHVGLPVAAAANLRPLDLNTRNCLSSSAVRVFRGSSLKDALTFFTRTMNIRRRHSAVCKYVMARCLFVCLCPLHAGIVSGISKNKGDPLWKFVSKSGLGENFATARQLSSPRVLN